MDLGSDNVFEDGPKIGRPRIDKVPVQMIDDPAERRRAQRRAGNRESAQRTKIRREQHQRQQELLIGQLYHTIQALKVEHDAKHKKTVKLYETQLQLERNEKMQLRAQKMQLEQALEALQKTKTQPDVQAVKEEWEEFGQPINFVHLQE